MSQITTNVSYMPNTVLTGPSLFAAGLSLNEKISSTANQLINQTAFNFSTISDSNDVLVTSNSSVVEQVKSIVRYGKGIQLTFNEVKEQFDILESWKAVVNSVITNDDTYIASLSTKLQDATNQINVLSNAVLQTEGFTLVDKVSNNTTNINTLSNCASTFLIIEGEADDTGKMNFSMGNGVPLTPNNGIVIPRGCILRSISSAGHVTNITTVPAVIVISLSYTDLEGNVFGALNENNIYFRTGRITATSYAEDIQYYNRNLAPTNHNGGIKLFMAQNVIDCYSQIATFSAGDTIRLTIELSIVAPYPSIITKLNNVGYNGMTMNKYVDGVNIPTWSNPSLVTADPTAISPPNTQLTSSEYTGMGSTASAGLTSGLTGNTNEAVPNPTISDI